MAEHIHVELPDKGPHLRAAVWSCRITWASCVVGAALATWRQDWLTLVYAVVASICAAGWWMATWRWDEWRNLALGTLALLAHVHGDGDQ